MFQVVIFDLPKKIEECSIIDAKHAWSHLFYSENAHSAAPLAEWKGDEEKGAVAKPDELATPEAFPQPDEPKDSVQSKEDFVAESAIREAFRTPQPEEPEELLESVSFGLCLLQYFQIDALSAVGSSAHLAVFRPSPKPETLRLFPKPETLKLVAHFNPDSLLYPEAEQSLKSRFLYPHIAYIPERIKYHQKCWIDSARICPAVVADPFIAREPSNQRWKEKDFLSKLLHRVVKFQFRYCRQCASFMPFFNYCLDVFGCLRCGARVRSESEKGSESEASRLHSLDVVLHDFGRVYFPLDFMVLLCPELNSFHSADNIISLAQIVSVVGINLVIFNSDILVRDARITALKLVYPFMEEMQRAFGISSSVFMSAVEEAQRHSICIERSTIESLGQYVFDACVRAWPPNWKELFGVAIPASIEHSSAEDISEHMLSSALFTYHMNAAGLAQNLNMPPDKHCNPEEFIRQRIEDAARALSPDLQVACTPEAFEAIGFNVNVARQLSVNATEGFFAYHSSIEEIALRHVEWAFLQPHGRPQYAPEKVNSTSDVRLPGLPGKVDRFVTVGAYSTSELHTRGCIRGLLKSIHCQIVDDDTHRVFFHGTSHEHADSILSFGVNLSEGSKEGQDFSTPSRKGYYCTNNPEKAYEWAVKRTDGHSPAIVVHVIQKATLAGHPTMFFPSATSEWRSLVQRCRRYKILRVAEHPYPEHHAIQGPVAENGRFVRIYNRTPEPESNFDQFCVLDTTLATLFTNSLQFVLYLGLPHPADVAPMEA